MLFSVILYLSFLLSTSGTRSVLGTQSPNAENQTKPVNTRLWLNVNVLA